MTRLTISIMTFMVLMYTACGDDAHDHDTHADGHDGHSADTYSAGLTKTSDGGTYSMALTSDGGSIGQGDIILTLIVTNTADSSAAAGKEIGLAGTMVEHGHGTQLQPQVSESSTPGTYNVTSLNLHMAGKWSLEFSITDADSSEKVTYTFDVE
jgi:hypothetical protein